MFSPAVVKPDTVMTSPGAAFGALVALKLNDLSPDAAETVMPVNV